MALLAVVIVSWNVRDLLARALESLFADLDTSSIGSRVVVVRASDKVKKGSFDGTVKLFTSDKERSVIQIPLRGEAL